MTLYNNMGKVFPNIHFSVNPKMSAEPLNKKYSRVRGTVVQFLTPLLMGRGFGSRTRHWKNLLRKKSRVNFG